MQIKHYLLIGAFGVTLAAIVFSGCEKQVTKYPSDTTAAQDEANASFVIQDVRTICNKAYEGTALDRVITPCSTISKRDTNAMADSLIDVNFGPTDCTSPNDGRIRRGHILAWYLPGTYYSSGNTLTITFANYYVNDIGITGTCTMTNTSIDSAGIQTWNYIANLTLNYPNGEGTATWAAQRSCTRVKYGGIFYYSFKGIANGKARSGTTYNLRTASPIYVTAIPYPAGCQYFEQGQINIGVSAFSDTIYLTYGTGLTNCNNTVKATIQGYIYPFAQQ